MTTRTERESLADRLARAEVELQQAQRGLDGSPQARTRYARARTEHEAAELAARAEFERESVSGSTCLDYNPHGQPRSAALSHE